MASDFIAVFECNRRQVMDELFLCNAGSMSIVLDLHVQCCLFFAVCVYQPVKPLNLYNQIGWCKLLSSS